jgi:hypothetical protein
LQAYVPGIHQTDRLGITKTNTLRVAVTEITFDYFAVDGYKMHGAKRAYRNTGATANAFIVIDFHATHIHVPREGLSRAGHGARGILTLLAGDGDIDSLGFPLDNADAAASGVGYMVVLYGADEFAQPAPGALVVICLQNLVVGVHGNSPSALALKQVRGLVFQAELFKGFRFRDAVFI